MHAFAKVQIIEVELGQAWEPKRWEPKISNKARWYLGMLLSRIADFSLVLRLPKPIRDSTVSLLTYLWKTYRTYSLVTCNLKEHIHPP